MLALEDLQKKVVSGRAHLDLAEKNLAEKQGELEGLQKDCESQKKALALLQDVASKTQDQLKDAIQQTVQGCVDLLFPGYEFKVNFVPKRGKVDAEFRICKDKAELDPFDSSGGGLVDSVSFALRVGCMRLAGKRPLLLLDEPFGHLRDGEEDKPRKELGRVVATLVEKLGVQVIMVGDVAGTDIAADKEYSF